MRLSFIPTRNRTVKEMTALHSTNTWDLVSLPFGKSLVSCHGVYTVNIDLDNQVNCLKACLASKRYTLVYDSNYYDTLSPVVKIASIVLLLLKA